MTDQEVLSLIKEALAQVAPTRKEQFANLSMDARIDDLGLDSIATMEMVGAIEDKIETTFEEAELAKVHKIADLAKLVKAAKA